MLRAADGGAGLTWTPAVSRFAEEMVRTFRVSARFTRHTPEPAKLEISLEGRTIWSQSRLAAVGRPRSTVEFDAAFTTPIDELERKLVGPDS